MSVLSIRMINIYYNIFISCLSNFYQNIGEVQVFNVFNRIHYLNNKYVKIITKLNKY